MRWEDERYVRLYTRDTPEWVALSWEARALFCEILRKVDRAGTIEVGRSGVRGLAGLVRMPLNVVERAMAELLEDGCAAATERGYVIPNFLQAQEARASDGARKRDQRERARAEAMSRTVTDAPDTVTVRDQRSRCVTESHAESHAVTRGHTESHAVTPSLAVPSLAVPSLAVPDPPVVPQGDPTTPEELRGPAEPPPLKPSRRRPASACPASTAADADVTAWLATWKLPSLADAELRKFIDHHRARDSRFSDWAAAWRTWSANAATWGKRSLPPVQPVSSAWAPRPITALDPLPEATGAPGEWVL